MLSLIGLGIATVQTPPPCAAIRLAPCTLSLMTVPSLIFGGTFTLIHQLSLGHGPTGPFPPGLILLVTPTSGFIMFPLAPYCHSLTRTTLGCRLFALSLCPYLAVPGHGSLTSLCFGILILLLLSSAWSLGGSTSICQRYCSHRSSSCKAFLCSSESLAGHLKSLIDAGRVSLLNVYEKVLAKIAELDKCKAEGARIRSRVRWAEEGKASTRYFLRLEKQRGAKDWISAMRVPDGTLATDIVSMLVLG